VDLGLANAKAVVVGGSRGMGLAAARCLAEDGARVALVIAWPGAAYRRLGLINP
jgi:NAD(P)-dependent dehydrogenase (short-subunit alcohol dehydrogenase family)